jgi:hypothetical protein
MVVHSSGISKLVSGVIMPISTRPTKSGEKKVFKKKRSNMSGRLNVSARSVARAESDDLVPGMKVDRLPATRQSKTKQRAISENRRRRYAPNRD